MCYLFFVSPVVYAVDDAGSCVSLVVEHKFADEIVHAINYMHTLQKRQIAGMEEFWSVWSSPSHYCLP